MRIGLEMPSGRRAPKEDRFLCYRDVHSEDIKRAIRAGALPVVLRYPIKLRILYPPKILASSVYLEL